MRIVQIIDSLEAGGAERMAVNYANALSERVHFSGLVATRTEGPLKATLFSKVSYLFLNKKRTIDVNSIFLLKKYIRQNNVQIVHAHATSFFTAVLLKIVCPEIKIIWHDHYGQSEYLEKRTFLILKLCATFFKGIISVNDKLRLWSINKLGHKKTIYLPNFVSISKTIGNSTSLLGEEGKRILCLANLREQKNHFLILELAKKMEKEYKDWTFHLVGKDFQDDYSRNLRIEINKRNLDKNIFIYGSRNDIENIIRQCKIAILVSKSEGLPIALLEYGFCKIPVVVSNVGEISSVIENDKNGCLINELNSKSFFDAIVKLLDDEKKQNDFRVNLYNTVSGTYSENHVMKLYLDWIDNDVR